jgi:hypothetical protein
LTLLLARTDSVAVAIEHLVAYPMGFGLRLTIRGRQHVDLDLSQLGLPSPARTAHTGEVDPRVLRFGMRFSDGSKVTNLGQFPRSPDAEPPQRVLLGGSGGGGTGGCHLDHWCWPLPPPGGLAFVAEWPHFEIELTEQLIDATLILDAAEGAIELWPDESE